MHVSLSAPERIASGKDGKDSFTGGIKDKLSLATNCCQTVSLFPRSLFIFVILRSAFHGICSGQTFGRLRKAVPTKTLNSRTNICIANVCVWPLHCSPSPSPWEPSPSPSLSLGEPKQPSWRSRRKLSHQAWSAPCSQTRSRTCRHGVTCLVALAETWQSARSTESLR